MKKKLVLIGASTAAMVMAAVPAFAVGTADTAVVTAITSQSDNVIATMGAVAPLGVGIFAIFLVWRYGKRIFKSVSN